MLEIYWGSGSPFAWRVLLAAELKGIAYESKVLEFSKGDLKQPAFLALSPRGKVPVIRDGDFTLSESLAILAYFDRKYPEPPLFGTTPEDAGRITRAISEHDAYVATSFTAVSRWLFGSVQRTQDVDDAVPKLTAELARIDGELARRPWLAGETPSAADVVWYPSVRLLVRASVRAPERTTELGFDRLAERYPNVGAWLARIEALPGYDRTYPPHWR